MATNPNTGLETTDAPGALSTIPADLIRDKGRGTESIEKEDVRPPRLLICQAGSPQRKPDDAKQIAGLNELDLFNDLSGDIYGRGPLNIVIISTLGSRHMQFAPIEDGGGVVDFNVPKNDPRTQFTTDADGKRVKPIATKFYDYLVWLPDQQELVALSMKSTQIKVAIKLNGLLKLPLKIDGHVLPEPPAWAKTYALSTFMDKRDNYAWGNFGIKTVGITPAETRELCSALATTYADKNVVIEHDETDNAEPTFDPDALERESAATAGAGAGEM